MNFCLLCLWSATELEFLDSLISDTKQWFVLAVSVITDMKLFCCFFDERQMIFMFSVSFIWATWICVFLLFWSLKHKFLCCFPCSATHWFLFCCFFGQPYDIFVLLLRWSLTTCFWFPFFDQWHNQRYSVRSARGKRVSSERGRAESQDIRMPWIKSEFGWEPVKFEEKEEHPEGHLSRWVWCLV